MGRLTEKTVEYGPSLEGQVLNGADLAVLVVHFLDGSSNRVEAGTDLELFPNRKSISKYSIWKYWKYLEAFFSLFPGVDVRNGSGYAHAMWVLPFFMERDY